MSKERNRITKSGAGEASSKGVAPRVEKPGLIRKLSYARWVPAHAWQQLTRPTERGIVHLIFALADHFEASIVPENGRAGAPPSPSRNAGSSNGPLNTPDRSIDAATMKGSPLYTPTSIPRSSTTEVWWTALPSTATEGGENLKFTCIMGWMDPTQPKIRASS